MLALSWVLGLVHQPIKLKKENKKKQSKKTKKKKLNGVFQVGSLRGQGKKDILNLV